MKHIWSFFRALVHFSYMRQFECDKCGYDRFRSDQDGFGNCLRCGWIDYSNREKVDITTLVDDLRPSVVVLPYIGMVTIFKDRSIRVRIDDKKTAGGNSRLAYRADCPFCHKPKPLIQGLRSSQTYTPMICEDNHRVMFQEVMDGSLVGWK